MKSFSNTNLDTGDQSNRLSRRQLDLVEIHLGKKRNQKGERNVSAEVDRLKIYLEDHGPGKIESDDFKDGLLADCWDEFSGSDETSMTSDKLYGRMEDVEWDPPTLTFRIARHGGTVLGSSREEFVHWNLNLCTMAAVCGRGCERRGKSEAGGGRKVRHLVTKFGTVLGSLSS